MGRGVTALTMRGCAALASAGYLAIIGCSRNPSRFFAEHLFKVGPGRVFGQAGYAGAPQRCPARPAGLQRIRHGRRQGDSHRGLTQRYVGGACGTPCFFPSGRGILTRDGVRGRLEIDMATIRDIYPEIEEGVTLHDAIKRECVQNFRRSMNMLTAS